MDVKDASLKLSKTLPNGAATATAASGIDTGKTTSQGKQLAPVEFLLSAPAMNATQMPDAKTMIYSVLTSDSSDLSAPTVLMPSVITQTGAGGAGCAAATYRFRLPSTAQRYVGFKAVGSASGDATGATATLEAVF